MFNSASPYAEISNRINSKNYLKVRQVCLEAVYDDHNVVALLISGYIPINRKSVMFKLWTSSSTSSPHSTIVASSLNAPYQSDVSRKRYQQLSQSKAIAVSDEKLNGDKYDLI